MRFLQNTSREFRLPVTVMIAAVFLSGCASLSQKEGVSKTSMSPSWRAETGNTTRFGIDKRAQEIERNLGIDR